MTPSAVSACGLTLDISGAVIIALGLVLKTPDQALEESTPKWNFNAVLDASIAAQTADAQVGAGLLVAGFAVQMASALGWHESSWRATGIGLALGAVVAVAAWVLLVRFWRPRRIIEALFARLRSLGIGDWWPALAAFGALLNRPRNNEKELIADYAVRLIGERRWALLTIDVDPKLLVLYTRPRSEIPGTAEYAAAHPEDN
jgi:hypothetical protein